MRYDSDRIDEITLALLGAYARTEHGTTWAWKGIDFEISERLHTRGLIEDPHNRSKSFVFTAAGAEAARVAADRWLGLEK